VSSVALAIIANHVPLEFGIFLAVIALGLLGVGAFPPAEKWAKSLWKTSKPASAVLVVCIFAAAGLVATEVFALWRKAYPPQVANGEVAQAAQQQAKPPQPQVDISGQVKQQTNAPCSGNAIGGSVDNTNCTAGYVPPPVRSIKKDKADAAIVILRQAPSGSTVAFTVIGPTPEITSFAKQIEGLFPEEWTNRGESTVGSLNVSMYDGKSTTQFKGEGVSCSGTSKELEAVVAKALTATGFSCVHVPINVLSPMIFTEKKMPDVVIGIGTRIKKED